VELDQSFKDNEKYLEYMNGTLKTSGTSSRKPNLWIMSIKEENRYKLKV
jgi:hypothetical protein